jgi:hypothetical protein
MVVGVQRRNGHLLLREAAVFVLLQALGKPSLKAVEPSFLVPTLENEELMA